MGFGQRPLFRFIETLLVLLIICQSRVTAQCTEEYHSDKGIILSPNYPSPYGPLLHCRWTINVKASHVVKLTFYPPFELESDPGQCRWDSVKVYDVMPSGSLSLLGSWCGNDMPPVLASSTSKMVIEFKSDTKNSRRGFSASWSSEISCGGVFTGTFGDVTSPEYPNIYQEDFKCTWEINVPLGNYILLSFNSTLDLDLKDDQSCGQDSVEVFDSFGNTSLISRGKWCGSQSPPPLMSFGSKMVVVFTSDNNLDIPNGRGFNATWTSVKNCSSSFNTEQGYLMSYNYFPNMPDSDRTQIYNALYQKPCLFDIDVPKDFHVQLTFDPDFDVSQCADFTIQDVTANGHVNDRFNWCDNSSSRVQVTSLGNKMRVIFDPTGDNDTFAFFASWDTVCGGDLNSTYGTLTTPSYPVGYRGNLDCRWKINSFRPDRKISLRFQDFEVESGNGTCNKDYVEIFDSVTQGHLVSRGKFCGGFPPNIDSIYRQLVVVFHSDRSKNGRGFKATYNSGTNCGNSYVSNGGSISHPNIAEVYPVNENCIWDIQVDEHYVVKLFFKGRFQMEKGYDTLKVYNVFSGRNEEIASYSDPTRPTTLTSQSSHIRLVFHSDGSVPGRGFDVQWKAACGGVLNQSMGNFTSPNYGKNYFPNLDCEWEINAKAHHFIHLRFENPFELEATNDNSCGFDNVEVFDQTPNGTLVSKGKFCGHQTPPPLVSAFSSMLLRFHTDSDKSGRGFAVSWDSACGDIYYSSQGSIESPNYPSDYPDNFDCRWEIIVKAGNVIRLSFVPPFSLEANANCDYDYLEVFDYNSNGAQVKMGHWCGSNMPSLQLSTGSKMAVTFHSDNGKSGSGFKAVWEAVCGDVFYTNDGNFTSPLYPFGYPGSLDCRWEVNLDPGQRVSLQIGSDFDLEMNLYNCGYDDIEVTTCGGVLNQSMGNFTSPNYGKNYFPNLDCEWEINAKAHHFIHLRFENPFELEATNDNSCGFDNVEVFDQTPNGTLVSKGKFCGHQTPPPLVSAFSSMLLRFHTDSDKSGRGFAVSWDSACGDIYYSSQGSIESPNYPSDYPDNFDCRWEIIVKAGNVIRLSFVPPFSLEANANCDYDYLEVFDYNSNGAQVKMGHWCGSNMPSLQLSTGSKMAVTFHSDNGKSGSGFKAVWEAVCGDVFYTNDGNFTSPLYPFGYPGSLDCRWEVNLDPGQRVSLQIGSDFDLEMNLYNCGYDDIEILDSFSNGSLISRGKWCGRNKPPVITSFNPRMVILFHSDVNKNGRGFLASWTTDPGCGGVFYEAKGYLMSPNYPGPYPDNQYCRWEISPPGYVRNIVLNLDPIFDIEPGKGCTYDSIEVFQGNTTIATWCGKTAPATLTTNYNPLVIVFQSDKSNSGKGFFLSWTAS